MNKIIKILIATAAFAASLCSVPVFADCTEGQSGLSVMPVSQKIILEAGSKNDYEFSVTNISNYPASFKIYASAFKVSNETYQYSFSNETSTFTQLARWITFLDQSGNYVNEATYNIDACSEITIKYRVVVPNSVPNGYQGAMIFAESLGGSGNIKAVSRVGLQVSGNTLGETIESFEVSDFKISKDADESLTDSDGNKITGSVINASAVISNTGNVDITSSMVLTVSNIFGSVLYQDTSNSWIIPESSRKVTSFWDKTPLFGLFNVTYSVSVHGEIRDYSSVVLIMPVFVIVIIVALITIVTVWIISLVKKNKERGKRGIIKR